MAEQVWCRIMAFLYSHSSMATIGQYIEIRGAGRAGYRAFHGAVAAAGGAASGKRSKNAKKRLFSCLDRVDI